MDVDVGGMMGDEERTRGKRKGGRRGEEVRREERRMQEEFG
jgi:hypothetical protein